MPENQWVEMMKAWKPNETMIRLTYGSPGKNSFTFYAVMVKKTDTELVVFARYQKEIRIPITCITSVTVFTPVQIIDILNGEVENRANATFTTGRILDEFANE